MGTKKTIEKQEIRIYTESHRWYFETELDYTDGIVWLVRLTFYLLKNYSKKMQRQTVRNITRRCEMSKVNKVLPSSTILHLLLSFLVTQCTEHTAVFFNDWLWLKYPWSLATTAKVFHRQSRTQVALKAEIPGTKNYERQTHVALKAVIAGTKNCKKKIEVALKTLRILGTKHQ